MDSKHKHKFAIAIHAGAGPDEEFIHENKDKMEQGLKTAIEAAHGLLDSGGSAVEAVTLAVQYLEDNPFFNAGCGSALNQEEQVEMCSSLMRGEDRQSGACAVVRSVKNPILLAKEILESKYTMIAGLAATEFAKEKQLDIRDDKYFITPHQLEKYEEKCKKGESEMVRHGTVGAVAVDSKGNVAAATSSGGTEYDIPGRVGDSSIIGAGCFASNKSCAVSSTGDGEFIMRFSIAHDIAALKEYTRQSLQQICDYIIHHKNKDTKGDLGVIAVDAEGQLGISFNSERMMRAWIGRDGELQVRIYD